MNYSGAVNSAHFFLSFTHTPIYTLSVSLSYSFLVDTSLVESVSSNIYFWHALHAYKINIEIGILHAIEATELDVYV